MRLVACGLIHLLLDLRKTKKKNNNSVPFYGVISVRSSNHYTLISDSPTRGNKNRTHNPDPDKDIHTTQSTLFRTHCAATDRDDHTCRTISQPVRTVRFYIWKRIIVALAKHHRSRLVIVVQFKSVLFVSIFYVKLRKRGNKKKRKK